jgi:hypothetical protein
VYIIRTGVERMFPFAINQSSWLSALEFSLSLETGIDDRNEFTGFFGIEMSTSIWKLFFACSSFCTVRNHQVLRDHVG